MGGEWAEHHEEPQIQEKGVELHLESNEEPLLSFKQQSDKARLLSFAILTW